MYPLPTCVTDIVRIHFKFCLSRQTMTVGQVWCHATLVRASRHHAGHAHLKVFMVLTWQWPTQNKILRALWGSSRGNNQYKMRSSVSQLCKTTMQGLQYRWQKLLLTFSPIRLCAYSSSVLVWIVTCQCFGSSAISVVIWFLAISSFTRSRHLSFGLPRFRFPSTYYL